MNTGMAVLLALVLIAVVLLVVWLVLRSRSTASSAPESGRAESGQDVAGQAESGQAGSGQAESGQDVVGGVGSGRGTGAGAGVPAGVGAAAASDPTGPEEVERTGSGVLGSAGGATSDGSDLAEEYVEPGLSEFGDTEELTSDAARRPDDLTARPRTPAEAFGDAEGNGTAARASVRSETSVLDETDVDSTPLFRSIREERLGTGPGAPSEAEAATEPEQSWSGERRRWDEQAHDVDVATDAATTV